MENQSAGAHRGTCWETYKKHGFRQFVVADIDFLGQRRKLCALASYEVRDMVRPEASELEDGTFKAVASVRDALDRYLRDRQRLVSLERLNDEERQAAKEMLDWPIGTQSHSDSLVYHICLGSDPYKPAAAMLDLLWGVGLIVLPALACRQPLRGGMEFHWAANLTEDEIYGPAPYLAYDLESRVADYPRIVVGDRLLEYLQGVASNGNGDLQRRIARAFAEEALGLVCQDSDGRTMVDFLGERFRKAAEAQLGETTVRDTVGKAYGFVCDSLEQFAKCGNDKLAGKYKRLKGYFDSKVGLCEDEGPVS